ncbi:MAG: type II CAAX endopeptidase family protein [Pseudomonadota bacterium]
MTLAAQNTPAPRTNATDEPMLFWMAIAGAVAILLLAVGLAFVFDVDLLAGFSSSPFLILTQVFQGLVATIPMVAFLFLFMRIDSPPVVSFREAQLEFIRDIGFRITPVRIALIAIAAGVSEEFLFRGVFQSALTQYMPIAIAILLPNIIFGLLHARTALYAIVAGALGIYLGISFAVLGSLLPVIIAHGLYDVAALVFAQRALEERAV